MHLHKKKEIEQEIENKSNAKKQAILEPLTQSLQCKFASTNLVQGKAQTDSSIDTTNQTGMPNKLKSGLEDLSGYDLSSVRVHYNSPKPKQLGALAFAKGINIHLGRGQEKHLPHEGWHVVQQLQGRVKSTMQMKGAQINVDSRLEREADVMGARAQKFPESHCGPFKSLKMKHSIASSLDNPAQLKTIITHTSGTAEYKNIKGEVGKKVVAKLDPTDVVVGTKVGGYNTPLDDAMSLLYPGDWARGHLLNHDLGGIGVPKNLFPITAGANARHSYYAEYRVKDALTQANLNRQNLDKLNVDYTDQPVNVFYQVDVLGTPFHSQFACVWYMADKNFKTVNDGNEIHNGSVYIDSDFSDRDPYHASKFPAATLDSWKHDDAVSGDYNRYSYVQSFNILDEVEPENTLPKGLVEDQYTQKWEPKTQYEIDQKILADERKRKQRAIENENQLLWQTLIRKRARDLQFADRSTRYSRTRIVDKFHQQAMDELGFYQTTKGGRIRQETSGFNPRRRRKKFFVDSNPY